MSNRNDASGSGFGFLSFAWRLAVALGLVLATFNPSGTSAYHWILDALRDGTFGPLHLLAVAVLLIGWAVFWFATWRALDAFGVVLAALFVGAVTWLLVDVGIIKANSGSSLTWISLVCISAVLAIGVSWSHLWRRFTGQYNVEDVDD